MIEYADLAWYAGKFLIAYAVGYGAGALHRAFVQIGDKLG